MKTVSPTLSFHEHLSKTAREAGFDLAGMVPIPLPASTGAERDRYFEEWIEAGHAGEMEYLKRRDENERLLRSSLETAFPWARSLVVCAANYNAERDGKRAPYSLEEAPEGTGWIARYAWSGREDADGNMAATDYHKVLLARLRTLEGKLQQWLGPMEMRSYVDTGPIIERAYAHAAGIGWTGKNTCVINQKLGSWLFLGVIVTSYSMHSGETLATLPEDRCGSCRRCIEACPTDALIAPYEMDASRCIAYLTIEKRGPIPEALRPGIGRQVFGCDICQDVCPWNRRAPVGTDPELAGRPELMNPALAWLADLDAQAFNRWFRDSPVKRTKITGMRRNVAIAMGNSGRREYLPKLEEWAQSEDATLRETAEWAVQQIQCAD
jgi:epoxyqueuosine reductase